MAAGAGAAEGAGAGAAVGSVVLYRWHVSSFGLVKCGVLNGWLKFRVLDLKTEQGCEQHRSGGADRGGPQEDQSNSQFFRFLFA